MKGKSREKIKLLNIGLLFLLLCWQLPVAADSGMAKGDCTKPLPETDLRHCSFSGKTFEKLQLQGAKLDGVDFTNAKMMGCDLSSASLVKADMKWAILADCNLVAADMTEADLFHTTFDGSRLDNSRFHKANMFGANLNDVTGESVDF
jgi:uncharacterized protein YjbI with pentapeptide repeats